MKCYIATFHTHLAAMKTWRALLAAGVSAEMAPVPRALSADCGACVRFEAETPCTACMHADFDRIVIAQAEGEYQTVVENDDAP